MGTGKPHQLQNVVIVHGVEHLTSCAPRPDEPHGPQQAQLVRHSRFAHSYERGNIADAQLAVGERVENPDACWIAKDSKRFRQYLDGSTLHECTAPRFGAGCVEVGSVAWALGHVLMFGCDNLAGHVNI
jgi:hypothetical protein